MSNSTSASASASNAPATGGERGETERGSGQSDGGRVARALYWVRAGAYTTAFLVGLSLLVVGTVAVIAEVKGTWHWMIHLESTISYMGILIGGLVAVLVPLLLVSLTARVVYDA